MSIALEIMRTRIIGIFGILLITTAVVIYIRDAFNFPPLFISNTQKVTGYVIDNRIVPHGKSVTHMITYQYIVDDEIYKDHYYTNGKLSKLTTGDSISLQVSVWFPSKNKVTGIYSR